MIEQHSPDLVRRNEFYLPNMSAITGIILAFDMPKG
jgi:hypothetical protein